MKKLALTVLAVALSIPAFCAQISPEQIAKYKENLAKQTTPSAKAYWETLIEIYSLDDAKDFSEIIAIAKKVYAKYGINDDSYKSRILPGVALWRFGGKFFKDGYAYAKTVPSFYWRYAISPRAKTELGLKDAEIFDICVDSIMKGNEGPKSLNNVIGKILAIAPTLEDTASVKTKLQKLNRYFTPKMVNNKKEWEPIVAQIRTALETY